MNEEHEGTGQAGMSSRDLETFIEDWYWDEPSYELARQMGAFLLGFIDHLKATGLSRRTIRKHTDNCWCIGKFVYDYGYHDAFSPTIFLAGAAYVSEFKRQASDSEYAVSSYLVTCRKLKQYVRALGCEGDDE